MDDPNNPLLSPRNNAKPSSTLRRQSSESYFATSSDYDEEDEGEKFETPNGAKAKRESFADFISALGQRVSLKGGITQNMKTLVNNVGVPIKPTELRSGSLYRNASSNNFNFSLKVVLENIPNVCNLRSFLYSPPEDNADMYLYFFFFFKYI